MKRRGKIKADLQIMARDAAKRQERLWEGGPRAVEVRTLILDLRRKSDTQVWNSEEKHGLTG